MNLLDLKKRVRSLTRDLSSAVFRDIDVIDYINEGVDRLKQKVPQFKGMVHLEVNTDIPSLVPSQYHSLLSLYSASRCFGQDERHYQATTYMNEFEVKLDELTSKIESGEIIIIDPETGEEITDDTKVDYVVDNYFY